jgi:hypothetical protein
MFRVVLESPSGHSFEIITPAKSKVEYAETYQNTYPDNRIVSVEDITEQWQVDIVEIRKVLAENNFADQTISLVAMSLKECYSNRKEKAK